MVRHLCVQIILLGGLSVRLSRAKLLGCGLNFTWQQLYCFNMKLWISLSGCRPLSKPFSLRLLPHGKPQPNNYYCYVDKSLVLQIKQKECMKERKAGFHAFAQNWPQRKIYNFVQFNDRVAYKNGWLCTSSFFFKQKECMKERKAGFHAIAQNWPQRKIYNFVQFNDRVGYAHLPFGSQSSL